MIIWLLASLIFDSIWPLKNKLFTDEIAMTVKSQTENENIFMAISFADLRFHATFKRQTIHA